MLLVAAARRRLEQVIQRRSTEVASSNLLFKWAGVESTNPELACCFLLVMAQTMVRDFESGEKKGAESGISGTNGLVSGLRQQND